MPALPLIFGMPAIALATYAALPALYPDEHLLVDALTSLGIRAEPAVWDDPSVSWENYDAVIVRS